MKTRTLIILAVFAAILFVGCSMPQLGTGTSRDLTGEQEASGAAGSVSVVMDESRGIAVYINESGQQFDVVAEEFLGGPLVKCVELADFTIVPQTEGEDSLPVKALVTGTREDGFPGVWEINADDTITLPKPEQNPEDPTRCIVGGDLTSLPDGMHPRFGWFFKIRAVSADGKIIVGMAQHRQGFSYNSVQVLPSSTVAVYWKVYRLPYSRFCIVSPPRVLGTLEKMPVPAGWTPKLYNLPEILAQLKLFFFGRFESYLTDASLPPAETLGVQSALKIIDYNSALGVYVVRGPDQDGKRAVAKISKYDTVALQRIPDLRVTGVAVSPMLSERFTWDTPWKATVTVENLVTDGYEGMSTGGSLSLALEGVSTGDFNPSLYLGEIVPGAAADLVFSNLSPTKAFFGEAEGPFLLSAFVQDPGDFEEISGNNYGSHSFSVLPPETNKIPPVLSVTPPAQVPALHTFEAWPKDAPFIISNASGSGTAQNVQLWYQFDKIQTVGTNVEVVKVVKYPPDAPLKIADTIPGGSSLPVYPPLTLKAMDIGPGTWYVTLTVSATDAPSKTSGPVTLLVYYDDLLIDAFGNDFSDPSAWYTSLMQLFGSAGDPPLGALADKTYELWGADAQAIEYDPYPNAIAAHNGASGDRPADDTIGFYGYPYIIANLGLTGDVYYVRLYLYNNNPSVPDSLGYSIRLEVPAYRDYYDVTFSPSAPIDVLETTGGNGVPSTNTYQTLVLGGEAFRGTLDTGEVHWYKFILP